MKTYEVECTSAARHVVVVEANSPEQAAEKIRQGKYKRIGRALDRGWLLVGEPKEVQP